MTCDGHRSRNTYIVTAAAHAQVGGSRNTSNQGEESAKRVQNQREDGVDCKGFLHRDEGQVEEGEHAEDGDEHVIVDDRGAAGDGEHVTDQRHTEEDPEEL